MLDYLDRARSAARESWRTPRGRLRHDAAMEVSQKRLTIAANSGNPEEELVAARILDNARDFSTWERQHSHLMKRVVAAGNTAAQKSELLSASLSLVHRKALFDYLRASGLRGEERIRLIKNFFANTDLSKAILTEHGQFLRSSASFMCSSHVGLRLLLDDVFDEPLSKYEQLYSEYFRVYCGLVIAQGRDDVATLEPLVSTLKRQVYDWRGALFSLATSESGVWRTPAELAKRKKKQGPVVRS